MSRYIAPSRNDRRNFGKDERRLPAPNQPRLDRATFKRSFDHERFRKHQIHRAGCRDSERRHRDFFSAQRTVAAQHALGVQSAAGGQGVVAILEAPGGVK